MELHISPEGTGAPDERRYRSHSQISTVSSLYDIVIILPYLSKNAVSANIKYSRYFY